MIPTMMDRTRDSSLQRKGIPNKGQGEEGQSTIEFILTFAFSIMFVGIFLRMAITATNGYLVHYATYMASRAYLVNDSNSDTISRTDQNAEREAKRVFDSILSGFDGDVEINHPSSVPKKVFVGVVTTFRQPFAISGMGGDEPLELVSESFLGRIPPASECMARTCEAIKKVTGGECSDNVTLYDNGC